MKENCPKCNTQLQDCPGIGPFCPNRDCDVLDNIKNWDSPEWKTLATKLRKNTMSNRKYGWKKDKIDNRDYQFKMSSHYKVMVLPPSVDLRPNCPPVYDQGQLGSCTANSIAGAIQFIHKSLTPSRLFIYWNEREMEGTTSEDSGAEIRDGISTVVNTGIISEEELPYDISRFTVRPSEKCFQDAKTDKVSEYLRINQNENEIKQCLASGFPICFGIQVYESFEGDNAARTGNVPNPDLNKEQCLGGHAILIVGYNDNGRYFIVRNSWGPSWGVQGYCYIPYEYILNPDLASDFWTIRKETIMDSIIVATKKTENWFTSLWAKIKSVFQGA